ncbi:response regulator [Roseofilum reptotaenium CS-1145]|uniref:histidine kinase n=1 Tax=Roseofilum reptotaenium AO1-A TaxID=1925591 RepID=A0A1L9QKY2_9CYAN|nr:response regulator [Roseofilum reptotaenium]MDB9515518.1 response regulator [Roseofilum reptotaenium CS-1145]OJJ18146.1 hybrid sensor histidine kinase/response regulator [Roseofilum reptotaenium AO1-A]
MNFNSIDPEPGNILVVDDTPANLQLLIRILSEQGYKVRPVPNGRLVFQGIHREYPDLILLDIQMPEMDGYEVCQKLKADERTRDIPVIFISALNDVFDKVKAFEIGGVDYMTKPFQAAEVLARVKTHIMLSKLQKKLQEKTEIQDRKLQEKTITLENTVKQLERTNRQLESTNFQLGNNLEELKKAQLQLVQSEKMATLGQLVAGVAHEINNPIGFIDGNIKYAFEYIQDLIRLVDLYQNEGPDRDEQIQEYIKEIELDFLVEDLPKTITSMKNGADRIRNISKSLRTFSRRDSDRKANFKIHEGIDSTLLILKYRLKETGERPKIEVLKEYGDVPEINCFPGKLNQVFMNLLSNAIDALDEALQNPSHSQPQRITIKTEVGAEKDQIIVWIEDNGIGMAEAIQKKVFDHLFTTKGVGKGTGLGLSISREIIEEQHGGKIWFESEFGKGTKFAISLPLS